MRSWLGLWAIAMGLLHIAAADPMEWIQVSKEGKDFVREKSQQRFIAWGFNYDRDDSGRLLEDYRDKDWDTVAADFAEMKELGANLVRIHLQLPKFMAGPETPNAANLQRLEKLLQLAEENGLYLDLTGLGCYLKHEVPAWYDSLTESARWEVQARFWQAIAKVAKESPAVFCYDLMNEPILPGGEAKESEWLGGELDGKSYVQRITLDLAGRGREEVARQWVAKLSAAIREVDQRHLLTVGVIPWAQFFKGAKPIFYAPQVHGPLDFVSVHFYPKSGERDATLEALKVYDIGKPLVIEEIFPLHASIPETEAFIEASRPHCDGWLSFYWGKTIAESEAAGGIKGTLIADWLKHFRSKAPKF
ncbi:cellulase family glycosylhydrolase [Haloferula sp. BvORR071]|uniref:cellulase family glycosylhydrolase n=1 Tax=Haloferula sp. BvORR071 TaxID=1396141 RepID=UPI0005515447|nr:cellulase family glycosylhydrolase [Haloferula sp. BvORR071]